MLTRRLVLTGAGLMAANRAFATSLPVAGGKRLLTISGRITKPNHDDIAVFDMPLLESLGLTTIRTATPWFNGPVEFEGVPMTTLMQKVGADGDRLLVFALNDYATEIPMADFAKYQPILALKRDGSYMPVADKGPLFIIYPFDSSAELRNQKFYSRSAWQVARMEVI
ncbi:MAG: oxidoreductase [Acetobacteraceae bacterium]